MTDHPALAGQTALVTGGSGAIGSACARLLLQDGAAILLMGRRADALEKTKATLAQEFPTATIATHPGDGTKQADVEAALHAAAALQNRLDIIISTIGGADFRPVMKTSVESFRATLDLNITTAFLLVRHGVPHMTQGGAIVCISSSAARKFHELLTPYCVAKAALETFIQSVSLELSRHRIRINGVRPGFTRSEGTAPIFAMPEALARTVAMIPLGRAGEPEDIARAVRFLAGPQADYITGQCFAVDGGGEVNIIAAPRPARGS
jgi:NAD(P)-dependent dehydrogenase (short-subunit alcohol dehydrogenase family)